jgi:phage tail sheath protein FI
MAIAPTYPGVYVEELPSGVHTITGVSTAVTAFFGFFTQGPMNVAQHIFSVADLERTFGPLVPNSEAGYSIRQFFANGGAEAWVVRVAGGTPKAAAIQIEDKPGGTPILTATAASAGNWGGNVRLTIDHNTADPSKVFNLTVSLVDSSSPPIASATEVYRNLTMDPSSPGYALSVVNGASALVQLSVSSTPVSPFTPPAPSGTVGADIHSLDLTTLPSQTMTVTLGSDTGSVTIHSAPTSLTDAATTVQAALRALGSPPFMPTATVTIVPGVAPAKMLQITASTKSPSLELGFTGTLADHLGLSSAASPLINVLQYSLGGTAAGAQASPVTPDDGTVPGSADLIGDALLKTGLHALDAVDDFNILCLPDVMNLSDNDAFAAISAAEGYCVPRWAFLLVDVPQHDAKRDTLTGIQDWLAQNATLRSANAALYYPRPEIPDPVNGFRPRAVPPSGTIAGLYARTDAARGVWKAPAGTEATLTNVNALTYKMIDAENGTLNPQAINCLRSFPVYGNVCWGARSLVGADQLASDWKYVPVRRTALFLEASLFRGTQWVVFEPNDEPLWAQIRLNVGAFMRGLFQKGAFQGSTPAKAYFVKCDSETTTQADINLGVVNIVVGFAPLKPAEFVILQIQQIAGQIPT